MSILPAPSPASPRRRARRTFAHLFTADAVLRVGYQIGKAPVLPVFAATIGADDVLLGIIVSVSVITGVVLKPWVGVLFDRGWRWPLLWVGTLLFALMPFAYRWAHDPGDLVALRLTHGLATAIYGPVTVAWIAALAEHRVAERLGWFGTARAAGYVLGPLTGGWLLGWLEPAQIYTAIGCLSLLALWPAWALRAHAPPAARGRRPAGRWVALGPALWLSGITDCALQIVVYALKTFLPVFALRSGISLMAVGGLLSLQELVHLLARPAGGRLADRLGGPIAVSLGLAVVTAALAGLTVARGPVEVVAAFALLGAGQAISTPALLAWIVRSAPARSGAGLGVAGALRNLGKVLGPIIGGALVYRFEFGGALSILAGGMAAVVLASAAGVWLSTRRP